LNPELKQAFAALDHPVPTGMGHYGRENNGTDALGHSEPEQNFQCRNKDRQDEQLAQFHADIERK